MTGMSKLNGSDSNNIVANQQIAVFYGYVAAGATSYTVTVTTPNGCINVYAMEVSGLRHLALQVNKPSQSSTTVSSYILAYSGPLTYLAFEVDGTFGPVTAFTPAAMTSVYDTSSTSGGHTAVFYSVPSANTGSNATVTFTTSPSSPIFGILQLFG
jgi:hypothetical protein